MSLLNDIMRAINYHSAESKSNTPDYILAQYLLDCLDAFNNAMSARNEWAKQELEWKKELNE
jgi:hypothetical protein